MRAKSYWSFRLAKLSSISPTYPSLNTKPIQTLSTRRVSVDGPKDQSRSEGMNQKNRGEYDDDPLVRAAQPFARRRFFLCIHGRSCHAAACQSAGLGNNGDAAGAATWSTTD